MISNRLYLLLAILIAAPKLSFAGSVRVQTAAPDGDYCLRCETDEACRAYAANSSCKMGQCTDDEGLFGRSCGCYQDNDCASNRCDGIFQKTCQKRLENGNICFNGRHCLSGHCNSFRICGNPPAPGAAPAVQQPVTEETSQSTETESTQETTQTSSEPTDFESSHVIVQRCVACNDKSECDGGFCINGLCADSYGAHPSFCVTCRGDDDCDDGTFCHGQGLLGRTGKKCAEKRVNGASCSRSEACQSGHCNVLFRCESNIPEHLRPIDDPTSTKASAAKRRKESGYSGLTIWASFAGALFLFGGCAVALCQKDGLQRFIREEPVGSSDCLDAPESEGDGAKPVDNSDQDDDQDQDSHTTSTLEVEDQLGQFKV